MAGDEHRGVVLVVGSANVDFVVRTPHIPRPGETVLGTDLLVAPGGKGANQAVAAARAGGASTTFVCAMGPDGFAGVLTQSLVQADVALIAVPSDRPTGAALITVSDDGENAIAVAPGANMALTADALPDLGGTDWLLLQLETPIATVDACARAARAAGVRVMLNAAPALPLPHGLLASIDVLVVNEEELVVIAGSRGSIAERLARLGVPTAIVSLGARGCCALADGALLVQPAFPVIPVDTTAAGDAFCGGLVAALSRGAALAQALREAAAAGALATTVPGAQTSIPTRSAVRALMDAGGDLGTASARLVDYCRA
jgi:ribokinase